MELNTIKNLKKRRSYYKLDKNVNVSNEDIKSLVKDVFLYSPSPYNAQNSKAVILLNQEHDYLWGKIVMETLREKVNDDERFKRTESKINSFKNAYGTVLIFEDIDELKELQEKFPSYHDTFIEWFDHSSGIVTQGLWVGLRELGLGANLQHYNPIIDDEVKEKWNIPKFWALKSQLVFGNILEEPKELSKIDINKRVLVRE